jgi:hypothetical protein
METGNPIIKLCIAGTQAEFQHQIEEAKALYLKACQIQTNDYEACIAAHYMASHQKDPKIEFEWNQKALEYAGVCPEGLVNEFFPSLYVNMGKSFERLGDPISAQMYYDKASQLGLFHQMDVQK